MIGGSFFRSIRQLIVATIALAIAGGALLTRARSTSWEEPLWVAIYPIVADDSRIAHDYVDRLDAETFRVDRKFPHRGDGPLRRRHRPPDSHRRRRHDDDDPTGAAAWRKSARGDLVEPQTSMVGAVDDGGSAGRTAGHPHVRDLPRSRDSQSRATLARTAERDDRRRARFRRATHEGLEPGRHRSRDCCTRSARQTSTHLAATCRCFRSASPSPARRHCSRSASPKSWADASRSRSRKPRFRAACARRGRTDDGAGNPLDRRAAGPDDRDDARDPPARQPH